MSNTTKHSNWKVQFVIGFAVSLAAMSSGVMYLWTTPVIPKLHNNESGIIFSDTEISWIVLSDSPGIVVGALSTHYPCDKFGRRFTLLASAAPILLGTMFVLFSTRLWMICMARFIWGYGVYMIQSVSNIYLAEVASKEKRGSMGVTNRFMYNFGWIVVIAIGSFASYQNLNYVLGVFPIAYFIACWWIPESPYYLLKENKVSAARKELMKLDGRIDDQVLEQKMSDLRKHVKEDMRRSSTVFELLRGKRYRKALLIAFAFRVFQFITGSVLIQHNLGRIMQETGFSLSINTGLITYGTMRVFSSMLASAFVDKVGRRPLLISTFLGGCLSHFAVGLCFIVREYIAVKDYPHLFGNVIFSGIMCFNIISTIGYDTLVLVVIAEIFPLNVKSIATSCTQFFAMVVVSIITSSYQLAKDLGGLQTVFIFFGTVCLVGAIFSYYLVPETRGKSLREIQIDLQGPLYDECEKETLRKCHEYNALLST